MMKLSKQINLKDREGFPLGFKNRVGQSLTEFALLTLVFFIIVLGIIEFSTFFYFLSSLNAASRNAVRVAIAENNLVDCSGIQAAANQKIFPIFPLDDVSVEYDISGTIYQCPLPGGPLNFSLGDTITVYVTSTYDPMITLFYFLDRSYTAKSTRSILVNIPASD